MENHENWYSALRSGVVQYGKKKKRKKRKYSKGPLRMIGILDRRMVGGMADGMEDYRKRSNKSAKKRRDGAFRDIGKNMAGGQEKGVTKMSKAPKDLVKGKAYKRSHKKLRKVALRPLGVAW